ncbi:AAA family ATPase [Patescibacteria group bacterium]|nr:AAA family ATPase [Patescibacteria group bacterium]
MKLKISSSFVCQQCGYDSPQWLGRCPECGEWNSLKEFKINKSKSKIGSSSDRVLIPKKINEVKFSSKMRLETGFSEVDTVTGGGIVDGSATLLAGDPGIGKSTLLLQIALSIAKNNSVLYVSGEESEDQIAGRISRVFKGKQNNLLILNANNVDEIVSIAEEKKPKFLIIDSIQTMESEKL